MGPLGASSWLFLASVSLLVSGQDPCRTWTPNKHVSLGMQCSKNAINPNNPSAKHAGGCGCENTLLRLDGKLYMMESATHSLDAVFPGIYNSTIQGDNSYFRIRDVETGYFIANVSESIGHSFCAAVPDHDRRQYVHPPTHTTHTHIYTHTTTLTVSLPPPPHCHHHNLTKPQTALRLWVFCSANARGNKINGGPCSSRSGCYVGVWNASFDSLSTWAATRKALVLPDGTSLFNNDA